jgi:hypothetical protein
MNNESLAAGVRPPIAGESYTRNIPAATEVYEIPAAWQGQGIAWTVQGGSCLLMFGTSVGLVITAADRATLATNTLTPDVNSAEPYSDGEKGYGQIPKSIGLTHFAIASATGAAVGTITFRRATFTNAEMNG